jgi:hypothetical protein
MTNQHKLDAARDPNSEPLHSYDIRAALADAQPAET